MNIASAMFGMIKQEFEIQRQLLLLALNALQSDDETVRDCTQEMLEKSLAREPESITLLEQMLRTAKQAGSSAN